MAALPCSIGPRGAGCARSGGASGGAVQAIPRALPAGGWPRPAPAGPLHHAGRSHRARPSAVPPAAAPPGSLRDLMRRRYDRYCAEVVAPFYRDHFSRFDRQIVLVDLLSTLNRGPACFADLQATLDMVMHSFRYGSSGLLARLFRPRIDTLLFAASKADHVAHNQHNNLRLLLERLVADAAARARFEGITPTFVALAAHRATDVVRTEHQGQVLSCVRGRLKDDERETVLFPGEIPADLPSEEDWQAGRFRFRDFAPRRLRLNGAGPPQHIRVDQALETLIGDRLQ